MAGSHFVCYAWGVGALGAGEAGYGAWMGASLAAWWRAAPEAEMARRAADLLHDLKPALLAVDRYRDVANTLYDMIEEAESRSTSNAVAMALFVVGGVALQAAGALVALLLLRARVAGAGAEGGEEQGERETALPPAAPALPPSRLKDSNMRMYSVLDKIF